MPQKKTPTDPAQALERSILASVLIAPDLLVELDEMLDREMFTGARRLVWETMLGLYHKGEEIDLVTVNAELGRVTNQAGVGVAVANLLSEPASPSHAVGYARRLASHSQLERAAVVLRVGLAEVPDVASQRPSEVSAWMDGVAGKLDEARQASEAHHRELSIAESVSAALTRLDSHEEPGIKTGFYDLDDALNGGLRPGKVTVLAGRPGMGKSAFALSVALNLTREGRARVALFSMEMAQEELLERVLASEAGVDLDRIVRRKLDGTERGRVSEVATALRGSELQIIDRGSITVASIRARVRKSILEGKKLEVLVIDYLQLLSSTERSESRNLEVGKFSRELKAMAMEFDLHVIALCQLSRSVESRVTGPRPCLPKLSDLRDSGSIEQDADVVLFLYRQHYYEPDGEGREQDCTVLVSKNRSGKTGEFNVFFFGAQVRFENACMEVETIA